MSVELSIIIVNWNGIKFLPDCLRSIVENPPSLSYEIVMVDNGSTDGSFEWLKSGEVGKILNGANFTLLDNRENLGFGKANNLAVAQTDSPYVFLLNPDTIVKANAIDKLLETLRSSDKIGAVAPKLLNGDGSLQPNVWGFPPTPLSILVDGLKLYKFLPSKIFSRWLYRTHWNYAERIAVPIFSGAAIMAKREMIDKVGAFDEDFHMYGEDAEWCIRINRRGWKTFFEPEAEIYHLGGQSSMQRWGGVATRVKEEEAFIAFQRKCLPKYHVFFNLLTRSFVLFTYLVKNFMKESKYHSIKPVMKLQLDSLKSLLLSTN
jgi:N-acetylglucosaminyl-diphospho-decaprenol L-rhamnosyltransferase